LSANAARASCDRRGWAGGEDQPQQFIADVVIQRGVEIRHDLLLPFHIPHDHLMLARQHPPAAQMIERAALGGGEQPCAGLFRNARGRPVLERGH
jgi:hypothetical protein